VEIAEGADQFKVAVKDVYLVVGSIRRIQEGVRGSSLS
jgi:hypothetical protein